MPELPEVETTLRGIAPHVEGQRVTGLTVRQPSLRWPIPADLADKLVGQVIERIERRGKYLIFHTARGCLLGHLGMSGSLRIVDQTIAARKHDHVDICFANGRILRYHDPRRFGFLLWTESEPGQHDLLIHLGPEPLSEDFDGTHLYHLSRGRKTAIKNFIMDSRIVVGVGNIYASESLFMAGIRPTRAAGKVSLQRYQALAQAIQQVLARSIEQGGTTLRDFVNGDGKPGYFAQQLNVYGRAGEPCPRCGQAIQQKVIGQRASYFCSGCQT